MHRCRNSAQLFFLMFYFLFSQMASADVNQRAFDEIANVYLTHALPNSNQKITKPANSRPLRYWPSCISRFREKCSRTVIEPRIKKSVVLNENFRLELSELNADLRVIFADQNVVQFKRSEYDSKYSSHFKDSLDPDCALYYEINNAAISNIVVLVSLDAPDFKQRMCLGNQLFQGLGLTLADHQPFLKLWKSGPDALAEMSEAKFDQLMQGFSIFTLIHMCPEIVAGMNKDEVVPVLRRGNCWRGLVLK